jgi:hypothetical protein
MGPRRIIRENSLLPLSPVPPTPGDRRIVIDGWMKVNLLGKINENTNKKKNLYALGDCAAFESNPLPPTTLVARAQGRYLANYFTKLAR